jgi:hypothetical protein
VRDGTSTAQIAQKQEYTTRFVHLGLAHQIIAIGFRALARQLHPNAGGSEESLAALNEAREWIEGQLAMMLHWKEDPA